MIERFFVKISEADGKFPWEPFVVFHEDRQQEGLYSQIMQTNEGTTHDQQDLLSIPVISQKEQQFEVEAIIGRWGLGAFSLELARSRGQIKETHYLVRWEDFRLTLSFKHCDKKTTGWIAGSKLRTHEQRGLGRMLDDFDAAYPKDIFGDFFVVLDPTTRTIARCEPPDASCGTSKYKLVGLRPI
jgi:hypothetical protein